MINNGCTKIKFKTDHFIFESSVTGLKDLKLLSFEDSLFIFEYNENPLYLSLYYNDSITGIWTFDDTLNDVFNSKKAYQLFGTVQKENRLYYFEGIIYYIVNNNLSSDNFSLKQNK